MRQLLHILVLALAATVPGRATAQRAPRLQSDRAIPVDSSTLKDRAAFLFFVRAQRRDVVDAADAMPADKYGFAPTNGAFANVRTFSRQVKHLSATNFILAAVALGEQPPVDAGDEQGPDSVVTKPQHLAYLRASYDALERAAQAIGNERIPVGSSPISPFQGGSATRIALIAESLTHTYDHYGQMVVYLRMNGVIPPASRR